jgi:hypothetical protein
MYRIGTIEKFVVASSPPFLTPFTWLSHQIESPPTTLATCHSTSTKVATAGDNVTGEDWRVQKT